MHRSTLVKNSYRTGNREEPTPTSGGLLAAAGALLLSLLLHGLALWTLPSDLLTGNVEAVSQKPPLEVTVVPPPEEIAALSFVETHPDVPQNEPDTTHHFAARSQQAAQEELSQAPEGTAPTIDGESATSQNIVEGDLNAPVFSQRRPTTMPSAEETSPTPLPPPLSRPRSTPDFLKPSPNTLEGEGVGVPIVETEAAEALVAESPQIINLDTAQQTLQATKEVLGPALSESLESPTPLPRPSLSPRVVPAPLRRSLTQASRLGRVAIDAKFSEFGEYQQRMLEAISTQWRLLARHSNFVFHDTGSRVTIVFELTKEGRVENLTVKETSSTRPAMLLCKDAILSRAPFGLWTEAMVAALGTSDTVTITFYYR